MTYSVKEIFYSLQGEGAQMGRPSVFCRFTGCNLWTGREVDRATAQCNFCDTDFVGTDGLGGGKFASAAELVAAILSFLPNAQHFKSQMPPYVVFTGGEPALQLDAEVIQLLHAAGVEVAIETNGTLALPEGIDWICVSPKAGNNLVVQAGHELKVVYPQDHQDLIALSALNFKHFFLQPKAIAGNLQLSEQYRQATLDYCLANPTWRLSLQTHKLLQIR